MLNDLLNAGQDWRRYEVGVDENLSEAREHFRGAYSEL